MSIENNPAIEILNTVVEMKGGYPFILVLTGFLTCIGLVFIIAYLVDYVENGCLMDGFNWLVALVFIFGAFSGVNLYAMQHPVEFIYYEVKFTDSDHFSLTDYEKLQENYTVVSIEGKIYTLKDRVDKDG